MPSNDEGGTFTTVDAAEGVYEYELATDLPTVDATETHTVGVWAWREFEGQRYVANTLYHFRPDGQTPTDFREITKTQTCNGCHNRLEAHGGTRREIGLCITCHAPGAVDPDTGNSIDMPVLVHKIHSGKELPSVQAGTPYQIIGFNQSVHDYSTVGYPQPAQHCETCHTGSDADVWRTNPSRKACGACHDLTSFEATVPMGMTAHAGGAMADDTQCSICHTPVVAGLESIVTKHLTALNDPASDKVEATIISITNTGPGQTPEMTFSVTVNGALRDLIAAPLPSLRITVAGPTTDYATYWQHTVQGSGSNPALLSAVTGGFKFTFPAPMPANATGSYAVGLEGYTQPGGAAGPRFAMLNPIAFVPVTDAVAVPRREIVGLGQCTTCHSQLAEHGGARTNVDYCAFCHNPNNANDERVARFENATIVARSVDLRTMIHKIHMGEKLTQQPYELYGFPAPSAAAPAGTPLAFGEVRFPGDQRACATCHVNDSYSLPLDQGLLPTTEQILTCTEDPAADANDYCATRTAVDVKLGPTSSACISCHDAPENRAHASTNTDFVTGAEACATCHGPGDAFDAAIGHTLEP